MADVMVLKQARYVALHFLWFHFRFPPLRRCPGNFRIDDGIVAAVLRPVRL